MTKTLLRLHRTLWWRAMKKEAAVWISAIFVWLYGFIAAIGFGAFLMWQVYEEHNASALSIPLAVGMLAYWLITVFMPTMENQLNPGTFASFPVTAKDLLPGFLLADLWQTRGLLVIVNSLVTFGFGTAALTNYANAPLLIVGWAVAVIVAGCLTLIGGDVFSTFSVDLAKGRGKKEKLNFMIGIGFIVLLLIFNVLINTSGFDSLQQLGPVFAWTPMGAGGGAVAAMAEKQWLVALARWVIAIVLIPVAFVLYSKVLGKALTNVTESGAKTEEISLKPVEVSWLPVGTVVSTLVARQLLYYRRDKRLMLSICTLPILALMFLIIGTINANTKYVWIPPFMIAMFGPQLIGNALGFDGPGNWLHMVSAVDPKKLLQSKIISGALIVYPVLIVILGVFAVVRGFDLRFVVIAIITLSGAAAGLGLGIMLATYNPYPVAKPSTNSFKDRSAYSGAAFIAAFLSLFGLWIPLLPGIILLILGINPDMQPWLFAGGVILTVGGALGMAIGGFMLSTRKLQRSWPEIFGKVRVYV